MANPVIRGDSTVLWGASGVFSGTGVGFVTKGNKKLSGEKVEIKDANGFTVAVIYFDDKNNVSFEMFVKTAAPTLARGDGVTICGVAYALVDDVEELWDNNNARRLIVTATNYVSIEDPAP